MNKINVTKSDAICQVLQSNQEKIDFIGMVHGVESQEEIDHFREVIIRYTEKTSASPRSLKKLIRNKYKKAKHMFRKSIIEHRIAFQNSMKRAELC